MTADVRGPVTGGVRGSAFSLPEVDVAARGYVAEEFFFEGTATSYAPAPGADFGEDGKWDAVAHGSARQFSRYELRTLYRSRDAYVDAYRRGVDELVAAGGLRPAESSARYDEAAKIAANLDLGGE